MTVIRYRVAPGSFTSNGLLGTDNDYVTEMLIGLELETKGVRVQKLTSGGALYRMFLNRIHEISRECYRCQEKVSSVVRRNDAGEWTVWGCPWVLDAQVPEGELHYFDESGKQIAVISGWTR